MTGTWQEFRGIRLDNQEEQSNNSILDTALGSRLVLAGTRAFALIAGQRKDEEAPGGQAAPRAFSAEVAQGAQEEMAPEKSQGGRTGRGCLEAHLSRGHHAP